MATVDIVIRTKNRPFFLSRALQDVQAQSFDDWHVVVVNDGGDPESVEAVVAQADGVNCTVVHLAETVGRPAAGNRGFAAGSAPFVALHDDDDTWDPTFLTSTVGHLRQTDEDAVAVRTQIIFEREVEGRFVEEGREVFHEHMIEPTYFDHLRFNHMVPVSMLIRRTALDRIGGFDESLLAVEDWWLNLKLLLGGGLGFLDEVLANWHQRPDSRGDTGNSVFDGKRDHFVHDRQVRDAELRRGTAREGMGFDAAARAMVDGLEEPISARLDALEAGQSEILRLLAMLPKR